MASGKAKKVQGHDFPSPEVPRAYPYGIYDFGRNAGFVNVGTDHDTGAFAVASIRGWWRGEPLRDYETIVNLIARTTTAKGLKVTCRLDRRKYPTGRKVSDAEMERINVERNKFHGGWNYVIRPNAN